MVVLLISGKFSMNTDEVLEFVEPVSVGIFDGLMELSHDEFHEISWWFVKLIFEGNVGNVDNVVIDEEIVNVDF